jgi:hypothetical protein
MTFFTPTGFHSFSEYWQFAWAREFRDIEDHEKLEYAKTRLERLGDFMVYPIHKISDHALRNIRNPLMILTVTVTAIVAVTILFYPEESVKFVSRVVPIAQQVKPWMIKATLYSVLQFTILGICLRTLGRLDPSGELWNMWDQAPRTMIPIAVGTEVVPASE